MFYYNELSKIIYKIVKLLNEFEKIILKIKLKIYKK